MAVQPNPDLIAELQVARNKIPRALFIVPEDRSASWQWRVSWPCEFLSNHGYVADWCVAAQAPTMVPAIVSGRYNVVITPRIAWPSPNMHKEWADLVHSANLAWIYEVDDDGWAPDIAQRQAELIMDEWRKGQLQLEQDRQDRIDLIRATDAVIVSADPLAEVAQRLTEKPVFCVPNLIYSEFFKQRIAVSKRQVPSLTIGWSGGLREKEDLENVAQAWSAIAKKYPQVMFVIHGVRMPVLLDALPPDRVFCLPWTALPDYPRALMNIDIACCSVSSGREFNESKTPIKWMETSLSGATCVVSDALYGRYVQDGSDALVAETPQQWEQAISRLIDKPALRRKINRTAVKNVLEEHSLEKNWFKWVEVMAAALECYTTKKLDEVPQVVAA